MKDSNLSWQTTSSTVYWIILPPFVWCHFPSMLIDCLFFSHKQPPSCVLIKFTLITVKPPSTRAPSRHLALDLGKQSPPLTASLSFECTQSTNYLQSQQNALKTDCLLDVAPSKVSTFLRNLARNACLRVWYALSREWSVQTLDFDDGFGLEDISSCVCAAPLAFMLPA